jgi:hypothetical protein
MPEDKKWAQALHRKPGFPVQDSLAALDLLVPGFQGRRLSRQPRHKEEDEETKERTEASLDTKGHLGCDCGHPNLRGEGLSVYTSLKAKR